MNKIRIIAILSVATFITVGSASGTDSTSKNKRSKKNEKTEKKLTPYQKLFDKKKSVVTRQGMFTLHIVDNKNLYIEIPLNLLGREYLLGSKVVESSDQGLGIPGLMSFTPKHITFEVSDSTLYMREVSRVDNNMLFSDIDEQGMQEGIRKNSIKPIVESFPRKA